ncbi:organelle RRM domain-containing protein 6, chloroplastic isoform X2 [Olea europaea var. sylvestris]|uniref:organelle RRM domain-containing protein 6, chloroplastic isoform X2 n=1 Tax=Olea europaea var. sylvestris TaxID=158386 RepID=UPI000C1D0D59|nr:organelle RRM domain-containing protein 6, chloroplastic isoform X2 [Olea europaea var. sylvestris]
MAKSVGFYSSSTPIPYSSCGSSSNANRRPPNFLKLRASYSDYPLASKIIVKIKLVKDEATKKSKGFAFIQYASQEDAMLALESMDHEYFDGRVLYVELAKPRKKDFGGYPKTSGPPQQQSGTTKNEVDE